MAYLGIDIGGTAVKWAVMDNDFSLGEKGSVPTDFDAAGQVVDAIAQIAEPFSAELEAVGVSVPGSVMEGDATGTVHRGGALPYLNEFALGSALQERLGLPVAVNNDGKCCALGEYAAGALRSTRTGVVLAIGTGIAGGIVIDGHVLRGAHCFAGEFSFLNANTTRAIGWDTVFAVTSGWHGLQHAVAAEKGLSPEEEQRLDGHAIFSLIDADDEAAQRGLDAYALGFDRMLLNLVAVLDPEVFAIGGGISAQPALIEALNKQMDAAMVGYEPPFGPIPRPHIVAAQLGNDANLYGAVQEAMRLR